VGGNKNRTSLAFGGIQCVCEFFFMSLYSMLFNCDHTSVPICFAWPCVGLRYVWGCLYHGIYQIAVHEKQHMSLNRIITPIFGIKTKQ
jgi:hypothetical protein